MKKYINYIAFVLLALGTNCTEKTTSKSKSTPEQPPNIILILADDLGYGELGVYGQKLIETPHLDELAAKGMRFSQFYAGSAVCAPSRGVLLTGQHTGHAHVRGNDEWNERGDVWNFQAMYEQPELEGQRPLPDSLVTIAEVLQTRGYATACVGKWGLGAPTSEGTPNKQGFDFFYGYNCQRQAHTYYPTHLWKNEERVPLNNELVPPHVAALAKDLDPNDENSYAKYNQKDYAATFMQKEALGFIENNKDQPFFLYYATPIPHVALQAPKSWVDYYRKKFGEEAPYTGKTYMPCQYPKATYAAMISYLDEQVGELIDKLKAFGIYDNSILFFTSDNGPTLLKQVDIDFFESASPLRNDETSVKASLREGGIRVPMIATWEGHIAAGSQSDHIAAFWDFFPSLIDLTGSTFVSNTQAVDGISFAPTLLGQSPQKKHDYMYWEFPERGGSQAIRQGDWKAFRDRIKSEGNLEMELYNLATDLQEQHNIAEQEPVKVAELKRLMNASRYPSHTERWKMGVLDE